MILLKNTRVGMVTILGFALLLFPQFVVGQTSCNPELMCAGEVITSANTAEGQPFPVPDFCYSENNALLFSFTTIDTASVSGQTFSPSSEANISISNFNCLGDSTFNTGLSAVVFGADDPCDSFTYTPAFDCIENAYDFIEFNISGLEPATTYYIMVASAPGDAPAINNSECSFDIEISGDAVDYNFSLDINPNDIILGDRAELSTNEGFDSYFWEGEYLLNTEGFNTSSQPEETGNYPYTVTAEINGCEYSTTEYLIVRPAILPYNTFTPNQDGINDTWEIERIDDWPNAQVTVFSRWGQKVFQAVNYKNDWDGDGLSPATYYFIIEINADDFDAPPYMGSVTIIY